MTRDEAQQAAKVLQHYADGGDVQWQSLDFCDDEWRAPNPTPEPSFDFQRNRYRIKPKPAEGWGTILDNRPGSLSGWSSECSAKGAAWGGRRVIHWREIEQ